MDGILNSNTEKQTRTQKKQQSSNQETQSKSLWNKKYKQILYSTEGIQR